MRPKVPILALSLGIIHAGTLFAAAPPDIVLIMVDDMGFSDIGAYGGEIETPNLDRLAAGGVRFRQFYNTAKCSQTRASLLSGRYYPEVTFTGPHKNSVTLAETLRASGYKTLMSGKWHLVGEPTDQGFDRYFGHLAGSINSFTGAATQGEETFRLDGRPWKVPAEGFYSTDAVTDHAIRFLDEEARSGSQPFFLYIAYNAPHYPLHAKKADVEKYMGRYSIGWDELRRRRFARQVELGIIPPSTEISPRPGEVPAWDSLTPELRREHELTMATFAAMVDCVDQNIGRLIAHLKAMGRFENTLFVFLSDNGGCPFQRTTGETREKWLMPWDPESYWTYDEGWAHASNTPFRWYKQNQHEGGISTPFIVHWPAGLKGDGRIVDGPGHLIDVAATFYDVAAAEYPGEFSGAAIAPLRGRSLVPILKGESDGDPREFWQFYRDNRALRQGDWKIASVRHLDRWELYRLSEDRSEVHDLSEKYPERRAAMIQRYETLTAEIRSHASAEPAANDSMR